jgi:hypothetical protein
VIPGDLREVVGNLVGIVDLCKKERVGPNGERIEIKSLDAGILREPVVSKLKCPVFLAHDLSGLS